MRGSLSWLKLNLDEKPESGGAGAVVPSEGNQPDFQWSLRSRLKLPRRVELDASLYFVDSLDSLNVPDYTRVDLRVAWRPVKNLEISVSGLNLQDPEHPEFDADARSQAFARTQVRRSVFGKIVWKF